MAGPIQTAETRVTRFDQEVKKKFLFESPKYREAMFQRKQGMFYDWGK